MKGHENKRDKRKTYIRRGGKGKGQVNKRDKRKLNFRRKERKEESTGKQKGLEDTLHWKGG